MNLPNYFLVDLPPEATLTAGMLLEACQTLRRNREQYLANRSTLSLIRAISETAENWLNPDYSFRKLMLAQGPAATGFPRQLLVEGLDHFFSQLTLENLQNLVVQELGHSHRLDSLVGTPTELRGGQTALTSGPPLLFHITGGVIPNPTLMNMVLGLLARSAQFIKCASGTSLLPRLFAHSLYDSDHKLASCLELAEWKGGRLDLEEVLLHEADCVTATGSDETLNTLRHRLPLATRFIGYGHRVSFGYVSEQFLTGFNAKKIAARAAIDMTAWNQLGCLSPHLFYVQIGGSVSADGFAELLAEELARREQEFPRGQVSVELAATIASKREFYRIRADFSDTTRVWCSPESTAWTVVFESDPLFQFSALHRFIYIKPVSNLKDALHHAEEVRGKVSTVGLAAPPDEMETLAHELARWGISRVCPVGRMQFPPVNWRHDGRPTLGELVTWTNLEM